MTDWDMEDARAPAPVAAEGEDAWDEDPPDAPIVAAPVSAASHNATMADDTTGSAAPPPADASHDDAGSCARPDVVMQSVDDLVASYAANAASSTIQDTGCAKLFVANLSWKADEVSLRREFEQYGTVMEVHIVSDPDNGRSKGYGYITFANSADAAKAMAEKNGTNVNGRDIRIDFATSAQRDKPAKSGGGYDGGSYGGSGDYGGGAAKNPESDTIFVGGMPYSADEAMLREAFGPHGTIIAVRIPTDRDTGSTKGFAYINFSTIDEARTAFEQMNGADLGGRSLRLDYAKDRTGGAPSGGGGGGGGGGNRPPNPPGVKLFIGNFPNEGTEDMLLEAFGVHGEITDAYVPTDQDTGASRGFAYLSFSTVEEAMGAFDALNGTELGGRNLRLDYAEVKERAARAPRAVEDPKNDPSVKLFVGGLSDEATEDVLRETFGVHGEITDLYLPTDQDTGASRGFAYLSFSTVEEATAAAEALNGHEMAGRQLRLDYAEVRGRPRRAERPVEPPSHVPAAKLFIGGLSDKATEDILRETFGIHGQITDIYVPMDLETDKPRGFAYLTFSTVEQAIAAVEALNGQEMAGRQLRLDYAEMRKRAQRPVEEPTNQPTVKLFVGGISAEATEDIIRETFGEHGELTDVYVPTDADSGEPRGFAYVSFATVEMAQAAAMALNGKEMAGRQLRIDFAEIKERAAREPIETTDPTSPPSDTLFVGGISSEASEVIVRAAFIIHGLVTGVRFPPPDPDTGDPKGFCWVSFASVEEAMKAVGPMNGAELSGRQIRIDYAAPGACETVGPFGPRILDVAHPFDPNEAITARAREFNTYIAAEVNVPDRFELFLLQDGEKKITEQIDTRTPNSSIFTILKEDHTLCNLLRAHLLKDPAVLFAGYKIPHPLFAKVELRVQTDGSITPKEAVISCSKKLVSDLGQFSREFTKEFELRKMVANASAGPQLQNGQL